MLGAGSRRSLHRRGRLRGGAEGRAVGQARDQDDQLDLHRAPRPGADRHRAGLERRRPARRDRGQEEGHRDRLHRARGRRRVLDGQLDDRRRGEEPGGRARVDQLRPPARGRGQRVELRRLQGAGDRRRGACRPEDRQEPDDRHPRGEDRGLQHDDRDAGDRRARWRSTTPSSRRDGDGGRRQPGPGPPAPRRCRGRPRAALRRGRRRHLHPVRHDRQRARARRSPCSCARCRCSSSAGRCWCGSGCSRRPSAATR